jgi:hypothetical protein
MEARIILDDPETPSKLQAITRAMKEAMDLDDRGRMRVLDREMRRICSGIRSEMQDLHCSADPELLIALWSTAQINHADGLEYARADSAPEPDAVIPPLDPDPVP